ncbi:MAG: hypothetical protein AABZ39_01960 [Spirochaetota bacterium]
MKFERIVLIVLLAVVAAFGVIIVILLKPQLPQQAVTPTVQTNIVGTEPVPPTGKKPPVRTDVKPAVAGEFIVISKTDGVVKDINDSSSYLFKVGAGNERTSALVITAGGAAFAEVPLVREEAFLVSEKPVSGFKAGTTYTFKLKKGGKSVVKICRESDSQGPVIDANAPNTVNGFYVKGKPYSIKARIVDSSGIAKAYVSYSTGTTAAMSPAGSLWSSTPVTFAGDPESVTATITAVDAFGRGNKSQKTLAIKAAKPFIAKITVKNNGRAAPGISFMDENEKAYTTDGTGSFSVKLIDGMPLEIWPVDDEDKKTVLKLTSADPDKVIDLTSAPIVPDLVINFRFLDNIPAGEIDMKITAYVIPHSDRIIKFSAASAAMLDGVTVFSRTIAGADVKKGDAQRVLYTLKDFFTGASQTLYKGESYDWAYTVEASSAGKVIIEGNSTRFGKVYFPIDRASAPEMIIRYEQPTASAVEGL